MKILRLAVMHSGRDELTFPTDGGTTCFVFSTWKGTVDLKILSTSREGVVELRHCMLQSNLKTEAVKIICQWFMRMSAMH